MGFRDTKGGSRSPGNKKHRGTDLKEFPVEKRMNSEAAVHQKPLTLLPDPLDSPVIYGVRVETPNPYHLLISKRCIQKRTVVRMIVSYQFFRGKSSQILSVLHIFGSKICTISTRKRFISSFFRFLIKTGGKTRGAAPLKRRETEADS